MMKTEQRLRDLGDTIKLMNNCITEVPEGEEEDKGTEKLLAEIMAKPPQSQ
jgi:hypothetical protein